MTLEVTKERIDNLLKKLNYVYGKTSENRYACTAYLDSFAVADGFYSKNDPKNLDEKQAIKIALDRCATNAYQRLWEFESYMLSRSLNSSSEEKGKIIVPEKTIIT